MIILKGSGTTKTQKEQKNKEQQKESRRFIQFDNQSEGLL